MMEKQKGIIFIGAFPNKKSPQTQGNGLWGFL